MSEIDERLSVALADRYTLERELGAGGMATVYLAEDLKHHRNVAVKVLRPELSATLGPERFVREIEIAANLSHPHVLPLYDSGEADGFLYYVMPYVEGESLRERLDREGKLPVEDVIRITDDVAAALSYAHERGIVHRDIKPENIMLTGGRAVVADFGIARAVTAAGGARLTRTGLAVGTPVYMSPEQAMGGEEVDGRSDVYALGCVVYEMAAGRTPFDGPTPQALLAQHAVHTVPGLRTSDPEIPVFVERAVERALAKSPDDRFQSANEFAQALTTGTVVARVHRRRRYRHTLAAAGGAVLVAAGWGLVTIFGGTKIERLAVLPLVNLTNAPEQEYLVAGVHEALISELAQLGISVIARATMMQYQATTKSIREIARELGVDAVIEGSLFRKGDSLEIAARLYDGDEQEMWAGTYDGDLPNAVALYRGFARAIAEKTRVTLSPEADARLDRATPRSPEVYEAYLRGMYLLNKGAPEDVEQALAYFNEAIEKNPADPLAYSGLALAYVTIGHGPAPLPDTWQRARAAAERAIRLDSTLAEPWSSLADVKLYYEWDWEGAERAFLRANELNPSLPMNRYQYAWYLALFDREEEAIAEQRLAQELDPLTPLFTVWISGLYVWMGRVEEGLIEARETAELYPDNAIALAMVGMAAGQLGYYEEAIAATEKAVAISPAWLYALGRAYAQAGRTADALRIVEELEAMPPTPWGAFGLTEVHAVLGHKDEAFRWLMFEPPHGFVPWNRSNPVLESLWDDPRFEEFLKWTNLPPPTSDL